MKKFDLVSFVMGWTGGVLVMGIICVRITSSSVNEIYKQAVERDYGVWVHQNNEYEAEFQWISPESLE